MSTSEAKDNVIGETDISEPTMEITSEAVYPIIATANRARFKLKNTGILSKDSVISLEIEKLGVTEFGFLPFSAGIYSALKSARLSIGGIVVDEMTDPAYYKSITHSYNTPDYRNNVDSILLGINTCMQNFSTSIQKAGIGKFVFGNQNPSYVMAGVGGGTSPSSIYDLDTSLKVKAASDQFNPSWTIRLSELFNILQTIELPLFLMNKEVTIDLEFKTQKLETLASAAQAEYGKMLCSPVTDATTPLIGASVIADKTVLFQDTIYYTNERMEQIAKSMNAKEGLFLDFTTMIPNIADHTTTFDLRTATTLTSNVKTDLIPVSNYRIKNIFMAYTTDNLTPVAGYTAGSKNGVFTQSNMYLGKYGLYNKFNDPTEISIRVNDKLIFNEPLKSTTQKAHETSMVYGSKLYLNHGLYSSNGMVKNQTGLFGSSSTDYVDATLNIFPGVDDYSLESTVKGNNRMETCVGALSFVGVNLSQGLGDDNDDTIMVIKPISVRHQEFFDRMNNFADLKMRYFTEIVQRFGVKDGAVSILRGMPIEVPVR